MVECKKAISAEGVNGDYDLATEWLRKNGSAKAASKLQGREASEGLVGISILSKDDDDSGDFGAIVQVASETDFASRSSAFSTLVEKVAGGVIQMNHSSNAADGEVNLDELLTTTIDGKTVKDALDDAVLAIRENLQISNATSMSTTDAILAGYVHGKVDTSALAGTAAAIVELTPTKENMSKEEIREIGKKLAMHVVAAKPSYLTPNDVPTDVLEKEKEILMEQIGDNSGKPPEILEKIVNGKLRKFYEANCLTEQAHMVEEGNPKITKMMKGLGLEVTKFEDRKSVV